MSEALAGLAFFQNIGHVFILLTFAEIIVDQFGQGLYGLLFIRTIGNKLHIGPLAGGQHHHLHDVFASTSRPLPLIRTLLSNLDAVLTSLAVARACKPSLLIMVIGRRIMVRSDLFPGLKVWQFGMAYLHIAVALPEVVAQLLANIH